MPGVVFTYFSDLQLNQSYQQQHRNNWWAKRQSVMGRKARHTARTGDGGAELRLKKRQLKAAEREQKAAELQFFDDPSENDDDNDDAESEGSHFGDEEEVLQLGGSDDDDDDDGDDDDDEEEDGSEGDEVDEFGDEEAKERLRKMDSKWGKSKKTFYSADTAEFELDGDDEAAKDEENAALELQRKQATMMDDEDFGFDNDEAAGDDDADDGEEEETPEPVDDEELLGDQLADISMLADDGGKTSVVQVKKDFSKMSKKDKLQIVNQTAPELLGLSAELENTMKELNDVVTPAILKLKEVRKRTKEYNTGVQYLVTRQNLMLNYVANISFYLLLRAEGKSVTDHPVLEHLLALKKQMSKLQGVDDAVNMQLHDLLTEEFPEEEADDGLDKFIGTKQSQNKRAAPAASKAKESKKQKTSKGKNAISQAEKDEAEQFYKAALREKEALQKAMQQLYTHEKPGLASSDEDSDLDEGGKRGASYEIIKNKGLKAHKSKLNRNPRVKKRLQYRKAVIRRKGQVRDVRVGEAGRYGGETTGIKSNLTRSRKIRS